MKNSRITVLSIALVVMLSLSLTSAVAAPPEFEDGQIYVVQTDDWLGTLADKFYGSPLAYPIILEATNAKAGQDGRYAAIDDPNQITVGQALFVPTLDKIPDDLLAEAPLEKIQNSVELFVDNSAPTEEQLRLLASLDIVGTPPELHNQIWLNSDPLKLAELHGKVVIVEFWTFG